jgi:transcriptional regulator with XRE-family HTH domain
VEGNLKQLFGEVLLQLREEKGVSQQELADNCNMERAYVSRLERGLFQPTITIIFKIADYFERRPAEVMEMVDVLRKRRNKK